MCTNKIYLFISSFLAPKSFFLLGLYVSIIAFTYKIQNLAFKQKITETATSLIMWITCLIYVITSIILVLKLEIPFILTGFLNLSTVGLLLKIISYAHVLNNVRYYIKAIKHEKNMETLDETLSELSKPVI